MPQPLSGPRGWAVEKGRCVLCTGDDVMVFSFADNEDWSTESICAGCLLSALWKLGSATIKSEVSEQ